MEIFGMQVILDPNFPNNLFALRTFPRKSTYEIKEPTMPNIFTHTQLIPFEPSPESTFWCSTCGRDISDTLILNCEGCGDDTCQGCAHILDSRDSIQLNEETVYILCTDCLEGRE